MYFTSVNLSNYKNFHLNKHCKQSYTLVRAGRLLPFSYHFGTFHSTVWNLYVSSEPLKSEQTTITGVLAKE